MTPLDSALAYAERGWRVVPIPKGQKHPRIPAWQKAATTDPDLITEWWTKWPDDGIGIACGAESGIVVIDIDVSGDKVGMRTLADLEAKYGELPETYSVRTGSGGLHYYFEFDRTRPLGNGKLGQDIDVKAEGGQVVAPPTIHPITGEEYLLILDVPLAPLPDWCYELLAKPERLAPAPAPAPVASGGELRPGDDFIARTTWAEMLPADGWTFSHAEPGNVTYWIRPGKDRREGHSASVNKLGTDMLHNFSTSVEGLAPDCNYDRFGYYAATRHGGDHSAAAADLRAQGYGSTFDPVAFIEERNKVEPDENGNIDDGEWEEPVPLGAGTKELPTFPDHVFPPWLRDHIRAVAEDIQVPVDLPATIALAALAATTGRRIEVGLNNWAENLNLYLVVASPPGQGKSPVFRAMVKFLEEIQADLAIDMGPDIAKAELTKRIAEKQARKAEEKGDAVEAWSFHQQAMSVEVPHAPRLIADDATPEALTKLLAENNGRLAIMSSEGGVFDLMTGKYSDRANLEVYLKAFSGDTIQVDRIGREAELVRNPALTIGLTVQPLVIQRLANKPELAGRGLTARFMYAMPESNVGYRDMSRDPANRSAEQRAYDANMTDLFQQMAKYLNPGRVDLTPEDIVTYRTWRNSIEVRRRPGNDLAVMSEWSSKLDSALLRTTVLLHVAHGGAHSGPLLPGMLKLGMEVADYWIEHAFAVHDLWGTDDTLVGARLILSWLAREEVTSFTASDVQKALRSHFDKIHMTVAPIELLIERGWVRPGYEGPLQVGQRGKPGMVHYVNPLWKPANWRTGTGLAPREWCTTSEEGAEVSRHSRHSRKDVSEVLTHPVSAPTGMAPPANDANDAQPAVTLPDHGIEAEPVDNSEPYDPYPEAPGVDSAKGLF